MVFAQTREQIEPAAVGQTQIQQHEIESRSRQRRPGCADAERGGRRPAVPPEHEGEITREAAVVFDQQDPESRRGRVSHTGSRRDDPMHSVILPASRSKRSDQRRRRAARMPRAGASSSSVAEDGTSPPTGGSKPRKFTPTICAPIRSPMQLGEQSGLFGLSALA